MPSSKCSRTFTLVLTLLIMMVGCGKKVQTENKERTLPPVTDHLEERLAKQAVYCEDATTCPEALAKIVIVNARNEFKYCTGFLLNTGTIATSSSCLPDDVRIPENDCSNVHIFFPKAYPAHEERAYCHKVTLASQFTGNDPALWRNDIAFLELREPVRRRPLIFSREPIENNKVLSAWKLDVETEDVGRISKVNCTVVHKTFVNPLGESAASPNLTIAGCKFAKENGGAPLVGDRGKFRGIVSKQVDQSLIDYLETSDLMTESIVPLAHFSNSVCLPSPDQFNRPTEPECQRNFDYATLDRLRSNMISKDVMIKEAKQKIAKEVDGISKFMNFGVDFKQQGEQLVGYLTPKCLVNVDKWLAEFSRVPKDWQFTLTLNTWTLGMKVNRYSQVQSVLHYTEEPVKHFVLFYPKTVQYSRKTPVSVWIGNEQTFSSTISETCPAN